jgi:hypothetical protein
LSDNYAVGIDDTNLNPVVSESLWSKVVSLCSSIREHTRADAR